MSLTDRITITESAERDAIDAINTLCVPFTDATFTLPAMMQIEAKFRAQYAIAWPNNDTVELRWGQCVQKAIFV